MLTKYGIPMMAALALAFAIWSTNRLTPPVVQAQPPVAPPSAAFAQQVGAVGLVESASENIAVSVPVPGLVTKVAVKAGDTVKAGDLLFALDDRDLRAELSLRKTNLELAQSRLAKLAAAPRLEELPPYRARVEEAKALLEDAKTQMRMIEAVKDKRAIRNEELEKRKRAVDAAQARLSQAEASLQLIEAGTWKPDLEVAKAEVKQAEAQVKRTEADLARLEVRAPIRGKILQCKVRLGEYAQAGVLAQPLILLGDVDQLNVRADVDEKDAARFSPAAKAVGSIRGDASRKYPLEFVRVEPYVIPKKNLTGDSTERVDVRVLQAIYKLPKDAAVFPGQQMDLSIEAKGGSR